MNPLRIQTLKAQLRTYQRRLSGGETGIVVGTAFGGMLADSLDCIESLQQRIEDLTSGDKPAPCQHGQL